MNGKPDWKDAPEWARYLAMAKVGVWYWYENEPTPEVTSWDNNDGRFSYAGMTDTPWRETLERRPAAQVAKGS